MKATVNMITFAFFLFALFTSCKSVNEKGYQREIYLGYQLGVSNNEKEARTKQLVQLGQFKVNDDRVPYYTNHTVTGKEYYSSPVFYFPTGDTIMSKLAVIFNDNKEHISPSYFSTMEGNRFLCLKSFGTNRIPAYSIRDDIINDIKTRYGPIDRRDTLDFDDRYNKSITWNDRNGVNIRLTYIRDKILTL